MSLHWIECTESWIINDEHGGHAQNIKIEVKARQGLNFECCKSDACLGACMPINFVELLHGESLDRMGFTERLLYKLRVSSIFFYLATPFSCLGIMFLFVKSNPLMRADAILFCIAGLMVFFGLANYVSVCSRYRRDSYTLGVSFYSCVFGFLVFESLAVLLMQNLKKSEDSLDDTVSLRAGVPDALRPAGRRRSLGAREKFTSSNRCRFPALEE